MSKIAQHGLPILILGGLLWPGLARIAYADGDTALAVYAGRMTDEDWRKSLSGRARLVDANLIAVALSRTVWRSGERGWSFELEGNAGKHWGDQEHWEANALGSIRFHALPWRDSVATSLAFGAGLSQASRVPAVEVRQDGRSEKLMLYWQLELTLGPPRGDWETLFRLHHRSTAYGVFGKAGGGNVLTAGIRYFS